MAQNKELWEYNANESVWVGKYQNSHNISHWHHDCELIYVCKGRIDIMVDKTTYPLIPGNSFFIESKKIHSMHASCEDTVIMIFIFDYEIIKKIMEPFELSSPLLKYDYHLPELYALLFNELVQKPSLYEIKTKNIIQELVIDILRKETINEKKKTKKIDEKLMQLLNDIDENCANYTLDDAVKLMGMNASYFSRFFHNATGISFSKYLNCVRVENAVELLHDKKDYQITEVAMLCGFQTIRNFNRIMKSYTGYAPSQIPYHYVFNGLKLYADGKTLNPTLSDCKLIEFSSPHN